MSKDTKETVEVPRQLLEQAVDLIYDANPPTNFHRVYPDIKGNGWYEKAEARWFKDTYALGDSLQEILDA